MFIIDNLERLKMAIDGIDMDDNKLLIYLQENTLNSTDAYIPTSNTNKKAILKTALAILEDISNNPNTMKNYRNDDISIANFAENLANRIEALEKKIRQIPSDDVISNNDSGSNFIYMFQ